MSNAINNAFKLRESISVREKGAVGNGTALDADAIQAALDAGKIVTLPRGVFRLNKPVVYRSGHKITGAGAHNRGYYNGVFTAFDSGTIILIDGATTAFTANATNCIAPEISGMTFYVVGKDAGSGYGQPANFLPGTVAIDETGVKEGKFHDLSFFNVEHCFLSRAAVGQGQQFTCRNHHYSIRSINDCSRIFKAEDDVNHTQGGHADLHFYDINGAIHLNTAFELHTVDGVTINNVIIFQCYERQIEAHKCQFVKVNGTFFENGLGNALLVDCQNPELSGTYSRAGWYTNNSASGIFLSECEGASIDANIERSKGFGLNVIGGSGYKIDVNVLDPMNGVGSGSAVFLDGVENASIHGSARVLTTGSFAVNATDDCKQISGRVSSDGMTAGPHLDLLASGEVVMRLKPPAASAIAAAGSLEIGRRKIGVPAGKAVVMNYSTWNVAAGLRLRVNGYFSPAPTTGSDFVGATLHTNSSGVDETVEVIVYLNNPTGAPINTGASDEVAIKFKAI